MKTMAEAWALFERMTIKPGTGPQEIRRLKMAFFTGGTLLLQLVRQASKQKSGEALMSISRELAASLAALNEERVAEQAASARAKGDLQ